MKAYLVSIGKPNKEGGYERTKKMVLEHLGLSLEQLDNSNFYGTLLAWFERQIGTKEDFLICNSYSKEFMKREKNNIKLIHKREKDSQKNLPHKVVIPYDPTPVTNNYIWRKNFYSSNEWIALRYEALKQFGNRCMCCGRYAKEVPLHVDHILPRSLYPKRALDINNLQILCVDCNMAKSNGDASNWKIAFLNEVSI